MIERLQGSQKGRSSASAWKELVWAVSTAVDKSNDIEQQTREVLMSLDSQLAAMGSTKNRLISATVYLKDMSHKARMDREWSAWIGPDPANWPQRACVGTDLAPGDLVEIVVVAIREI